MKTSDAIDQLITAMTKARPLFPRITKNRKVTVKSDRGTYDFEYATLDVILEAVVEPLTAHGLVPLFGVCEGSSGGVQVVTRLCHSSGQWAECAINVGKPDQLQKLGSAITYGKRYGITALLGIQADDDDDGNSAVGNAVQPRQEIRPTPNGNGHTTTPQAPAKTEVDRPTDQDITALFALAEQCHEPTEVFEVRLRTIMQLKPSASVSRRLLPRTMTMEDYMRAVAYYQTLLAQLEQVKEGVSAPASVATVDERAQARDALRTEALGWGIKATEVEHILTHHTDLGKARALLWRARRPSADTLVTAGGD
jgi:hypothetical protein